MNFELSDYVYEGYRGFGGGDEVLASTACLLTAMEAAVALVVGAQKTHADARLDAPAGGQDEVVAVGQAGTHEVAFITLTSHTLEQAQWEFHIAYIIFSIHQMYAKEVSAKRLAHPVAKLGLNEPVLPAFVFACRERIIMETGFQREAFGEFYFYTYIRRSKHTRQQVGLYGDALRSKPCGTREGNDKGQYERQASHRSGSFISSRYTRVI